MKKLLIAFASLLALASCTDDRGLYLKVYNWGDYIDEDLLGEFEQWYQEQTGEEVHVIYQTFDINETMLSKIEKGHEDYDVVCPSDYIIERMLQNDLILPIDKDFGETPNYIDGYISPFIKGFFDKMQGNGKNANDYAVCYMWGTTGYLYNMKYVTAEEVQSWNAMKNDKFIGRIFLKDAPRDVFAQVIIYLNRDRIANGEVTIDELMLDSSDENIALVEEYLKEMPDRIAGWEADFGKEQMAQEKGLVNLTWSGDAKFAMMSAEEMNIPLGYEVPIEGSTVWFDGWVIPKYARNVKAARYFINYLNRPDNAARNMDYIGYVSSNNAPDILEAMEDEETYPETVDVSYFFTSEDTARHLDPVMYPDKSVVDRCAMEHDWGDDTEKLIAMWSRVKGNQLSTWTIIVIVTTFSAIIISEIVSALHKRHRKVSRTKRIKQRKK